MIAAKTVAIASTGFFTAAGAILAMLKAEGRRWPSRITI